MFFADIIEYKAITALPWNWWFLLSDLPITATMAAQNYQNDSNFFHDEAILGLILKKKMSQLLQGMLSKGLRGVELGE